MGIRSLSTASISTGVKRSKVWDQSAVVLVGAFESIQTVTVGSTAVDSITFSSIPSTYKYLQVRWLARTTRTEVNDGFGIQFNGDTANNYGYHYIAGTGAAAARYGELTRPSIDVPYVAAASSTSGIFGLGICNIYDYTDTNKYKTITTVGGGDYNSSGWVAQNSSFWNSSSAITSIKFQTNALGDFAQYSHFALYGIKG